MPTCWIIAGPNGAGKTTFALEYLPTIPACDRFLNTDLMAYALNPLNPAQQTFAAGRLFLKELRGAIDKRKSFAFETTLSGKSYLTTLKKMKEEGWHLHLIYLALPNATISAKRVAERVKGGGHDVPEKDIERRYPRSLGNLFGDYGELVDLTWCYWSEDGRQTFIFKKDRRQLSVQNDILYNYLIEKNA